MPTSDPYNVLFLCTGNSARSILAESILSHPAVAQGRFRAFSAGSQPQGRVNPFAIELLRENRYPVAGLRSKSWDEFAMAGTAAGTSGGGERPPVLHFVFTVCDNAAGEVCPIWPGQPISAHWGVPDPAAVEGSDEDRRRAFFQAFTVLHNRIRLFASLPLAQLDRLVLQRRLTEIGRAGEPVTAPSAPA